MLDEAWVLTPEGEVKEKAEALEYRFEDKRTIVIDYDLDFIKIDRGLGDTAGEGIKVWSEKLEGYEWLFGSTFELNEKKVNVSLYVSEGACSKIQLMCLSSKQLKSWKEYKKDTNCNLQRKIGDYRYFVASAKPLLFRDKQPRRSLEMRDYSLESKQLVVYPAHAIYWTQEINK